MGTKRFVAGLLVLTACAVAHAQLPEVSEAALAELGSSYGIPQVNGFVFVDGHYLSPPYTVTRKGNGIFIKGLQVEQPVAWGSPAAEGTAAPGENGQPARKALDADGDFEEVAAAAPPAAPAVPEAEAAPAAPKTVKSIDDLFDDETPAKPAPPAGKTAAVAVAEAGGVAMKSEAEPVRDKEAVIAGLERIRKGYEQALARGDIFFFGQRHSRVNGNYGSARTLMAVLPKALSGAQSPQDLMQRLNQGGVYFVDLGLCAELFRNKKDYPQLHERLKRIESAEAAEAEKRKSARAW